MRQTRNFRYTARGRPQSWHRCSCRELNFGGRFALAIFDLLAMPDRLGLSVVREKMIPLRKLVQAGVCVLVTVSRTKEAAINLVPKLRLGTHFRETLFRERQSRALPDVCTQAAAWIQVISFLLQTAQVLRVLFVLDLSIRPSICRSSASWKNAQGTNQAAISARRPVTGLVVVFLKRHSERTQQLTGFVITVR